MIEIINIGGVFMYLSYSKLSTFNDCPKKYKLQYIDKVEETSKSEIASTGILYHKVLAELEEGLDEKQIRKIAESILMKENISYEKIKEIEDVIINWYDPFDFKNVFGKEMKIEFNLLNHTFIGYIDRLDKFDDKSYEIIDYKSGNYDYSDSDLKNSLQFDVYSYAIFKLYKPDIVMITYDNIQTKHKVHAQITIDEFPIIENRLISYIKKIESAKTFPAFLGNHCLYCSFRDKCEEFKNDKYEFDDIVKSYAKAKIKGKYYKDEEKKYSDLLAEQMTDQNIEEIQYGSYSIKFINGKVYFNKGRK